MTIHTHPQMQLFMGDFFLCSHFSGLAEGDQGTLFHRYSSSPTWNSGSQDFGCTLGMCEHTCHVPLLAAQTGEVSTSQQGNENESCKTGSDYDRSRNPTHPREFWQISRILSKGPRLDETSQTESVGLVMTVSNSPVFEIGSWYQAFHQSHRLVAQNAQRHASDIGVKWCEDILYEYIMLCKHMKRN